MFFRKSNSSHDGESVEQQHERKVIMKSFSVYNNVCESIDYEVSVEVTKLR